MLTTSQRILIEWRTKARLSQEEFGHLFGWTKEQVRNRETRQKLTLRDVEEMSQYEFAKRHGDWIIKLREAVQKEQDEEAEKELVALGLREEPVTTTLPLEPVEEVIPEEPQEIVETPPVEEPTTKLEEPAPKKTRPWRYPLTALVFLTLLFAIWWIDRQDWISYPTPSPTVTITPAATISPTPTYTLTPTATPTETVTPTNTPAIPTATETIGPDWDPLATVPTVTPGPSPIMTDLGPVPLPTEIIATFKVQYMPSTPTAGEIAMRLTE